MLTLLDPIVKEESEKRIDQTDKQIAKFTVSGSHMYLVIKYYTIQSILWGTPC